uniref:Transcriptional regulator n=1 Tax=Heterorhabditis bacteriophora TaxID=37862 RepID=A0A1I7WFT2_HETBA
MSTLLPDGTTRFVAAANIVVLASQSPNRLKLIRQMVGSEKKTVNQNN